MSEKPVIRQRLRTMILPALFTVLYVAVAFLRYRRRAVVVYDDGLFMQALDGYAHLRAPIIDIREPGLNVLGEHFSPIYALLAPVYRLWPNALVLHLAMALLLGLSVAVVAVSAHRHLSQWPALAVTFFYGASFGLQGFVGVGFYEVAFAVPIIALMGLAYLDGNYRHLAFWSVLLLFVKEDLGLTVAMVGVVLVLQGQSRLGIALGILGTTWTAVVMIFVIPSFNSTGNNRFFNEVGGNGGLLETLIDGSGIKLFTLVATFGVTGFLALRSQWCLLVLPTLVWRFTSEKELYWTILWHYSAVLMPIVFIAMIEVLRRQPRDGQSRWAGWPALATSGVFVVALAGFGPLIELAYPSSWRADDRAATVERVLDHLDEDAVVLTDASLINRIVPNHQTFMVQTAQGTKPDVAVFDTRNYLRNGLPGAKPVGQLAEIRNPEQAKELLTDLVGGTWVVTFDEAGFLILEPVGSTQSPS